MHFSFASDEGVEAKGLHFAPPFVRAHASCPPLPSESAVATAAEESAAVLEGYATALQQRSTDLAQEAAQAAADAAAAAQAAAAAKQAMHTGNSAAPTAATQPTGEMAPTDGTPAVSPPADSATPVVTTAASTAGTTEMGQQQQQQQQAAAAGGDGAAATGAAPSSAPSAGSSTEAQVKAAQREADSVDRQHARLLDLRSATQRAAQAVQAQATLAQGISMPVTLHKVHLIRSALVYLAHSTDAHAPVRALALWGALQALLQVHVAREDELDGPTHLAAMHEDNWMHAGAVSIPQGGQCVQPDTWHVHVTNLAARAAWLAGELAVSTCIQLRPRLHPRSQLCVDTVLIVQHVDLATMLYSVMRDTPICVPEHATAPPSAGTLATSSAPEEQAPHTPLLNLGHGSLGVLGDAPVSPAGLPAWRTRCAVLLSSLQHGAAAVRIACHRQAGTQITFDARQVETSLAAAVHALASQAMSRAVVSELLQAAQQLVCPAWQQSLWGTPQPMWHLVQLIARGLRQLGHLLARIPTSISSDLHGAVLSVCFDLHTAALRAFHCSWVMSAAHNTRGRKGRSSGQEALWHVCTVHPTRGGSAAGVAPSAPHHAATRGALAVSLGSARSSAASKTASTALFESAYRVTAAHCKAVLAAVDAVLDDPPNTPHTDPTGTRRTFELTQVLDLHIPTAAAGGSVASPLASPPAASPQASAPPSPAAGAPPAPGATCKAVGSAWTASSECEAPDATCTITRVVLLDVGCGNAVLCAACVLPTHRRLLLPLQAVSQGVQTPLLANSMLHAAVQQACKDGVPPEGRQVPMRSPPPPVPPLHLALHLLAELLSALHSVKYLLGTVSTEARLMRKQEQLLAALPGLQARRRAGMQSPPPDPPLGRKRARSESTDEANEGAVTKAARDDNTTAVPTLILPPAPLHLSEGTPPLLCIPPSLGGTLSALDAVLNSQKSLRNNQLVSVWHAEPPPRQQDWHLAAAMSLLWLPPHAPSDALTYAGSDEPFSGAVTDCVLHLDRRMRTYETRRCVALHTLLQGIAGHLSTSVLAWPWRPYKNTCTPGTHNVTRAVELLLDVALRLVSPQEGSTCVTLPVSARLVGLLAATLQPHKAAQVWRQQGGANVQASVATAAAAAACHIAPPHLQQLREVANQLAQGAVLGLRKAGRSRSKDALAMYSPEAASVIQALCEACFNSD